MRNFTLVGLILIGLIAFQWKGFCQDGPITPNVIKTPVAFEITGRLDENPIVDFTTFEDVEFKMNAHRDREINPNVFPPDFENMPMDPGVQTKAGWKDASKATLLNVAGQNSGSYPPDCNGSVNSNYYFQVVNVTYAIYNKSGSLVAGPSPLNSIFNSSLPGAGENDGDPIVLWDEQAGRWLYAEFSLNNSNDYMLIAVSQTSDPTGSWYSWSFDVDDTPDYMKFGIWQDGYYMATNTSGGNDVYAFDRSAMIAGNASPTMIGFDNPWRPSTFDGFHCILPLDNDGPWAPSGDPGQFITIVDGGQGNPADQLWIYELSANWSSPGSSTFNRVQQLNVNSFSGNFNNSWNNIPQQGTSQTLDGLSTILMFRAQYRNFSGDQRLVCAHAIAESSNEAAMRWYELQNTGSGWSIRQQSTYNPDNISRWNMSIAMNGSKEIGIGYSVSNGSMYPGIRYIGQSTAANTAANNTLDMAETNVWTGSYYQSTYNRWGDYANISIDPSDDHTFWFTSEYVASSTHGTRIVSFQFSSPSSPPIADFSADNLYPANSFTTVNFSDASTNNPTSWSWSFSPSTVTYIGSTSSSSQNPSVRFNNPGAYTVTLTATNAYGSDSETKTAYIHMGTPGNWTGATSTDWNTNTNWENHIVADASTNVSITPAAIRWPTKTGDLTIGTDCNSLNMSAGYTALTVTGDLTISIGNTLYVDPSGIPDINVEGDFNCEGTFTPGLSNFNFNGSVDAVVNSASSSSSTIVITECNQNTPDFIEVQNVSGAYFDASNYLVAVSASYSNINAVNTTYWSLGAFAAGAIQYRTDQNGNNYWGSNIYWNTGSNGWAIIIDNSNGAVIDFVNWGWSTAQIATFNPTINGHSITLGSEWTGSSLNSICTNSQTRQGSLDNNDATDFTCLSSSMGTQNPGLTVPFGGGASLLVNFNAVGINKTASSKVTFDADVSIAQSLTLNSGSWLTNNTGKTNTIAGDMILMSNSTSKSSYVDLGTTNISGSVYAQKYYTDNRWHNVSSPLTDGLSGIYLDMYLYSWDEANNWWFNIVPEDVLLEPGVGYLVWSTIGNPTVSFTGGTLNNGNYSPVLSYTDRNTNSTVDADEGWNMVGNAYPSAIDIMAGGYTWTSLLNTIYMYDGTQYVLFNRSTGVGSTGVTRYIPSMQGFFVKVSATSPSPALTIPNSARLHDGQLNYKSDVVKEEIRLEVSGNNLQDELILLAIQGASEGFDEAFDAYKLFGNEENPQLYTMAGEDQLAMNALNDFASSGFIPVACKVGSSGIYQLKVSELNLQTTGQSVLLEDRLTQAWVEMSQGSVYEFESALNDDPYRFNIHFIAPNIEEPASESISVYSFDNIVYVSLPEMEEEAEIQIFDMLGQKMYDVHTMDLFTIIPLNISGYYLVKVQTVESSMFKKVFIKH